MNPKKLPAPHQSDAAGSLKSSVSLEQSEEIFRLAFDNANIGMCLVDLQGNLLKVNIKMEAIFGYSKSELEGMTVNDLALPQDQNTSPEFIDNAIKGESNQATFEKRYRHKDGHIVYGLISSSLVHDSTGKPNFFISQVQDITHHKHIEDELRISERRHHVLAENTKDVVWTMNLGGTLTYISPAIEKLLGLTPEEALNQSLDQFLTPDSLLLASHYLAKLHEATKNGMRIEPFREELEYQRKDGSRLWTEALAYPIYADDGHFVEILGLARDIDERKRLEQELASEQNMLNAVLNTIPDLIWLKDLDGVYLSCNAEFEKFFGAKMVDIVGKTDYDFVSKETADIFRENDLAAIAANAPRAHDEAITYASDGHTAIFETIKTPMRDSSGKLIGVLGFAHNITQRKHLENQITHLAFYDALTELPNRRLLMDRLNQLLVGKKRSGLYGALLYIDLDNFKPLNDEHGHEAGDFLLIEVGNRIKTCLREMDTVARIGGDEFVALIGQLEGDKTKSFTHAKTIAKKVWLALSEPYRITIAHGQEAGLTIEHHCTASIGVAVFSGKVTDPEVILSMADVAMYEAKEAGRNQVKLNSSVI